MAKERVQKILAKAGIASRRKAEELITMGEVTINGQVAKLGDQAEWGVDAVKVNGKLITATEQPVYLAFYKPKNVICAMEDPQGRPALAPYFVRVLARIYPIGRLDFTSEGLVLLTNDGAITEKIAKS
ncbi:MAG: rRNA pseudouridine synthase, partial [Betaproteobacteria bacterium]|nr:rRNA pseudouridine synthase [Betaproteobacteria bacterium]